MTAFLKFLAALPALFRLIQTIQKIHKEAGTERKVAEDIKTIQEAFHEKDPAKLNALFSS